MTNKVVTIHQPNFFPWLGLFSKIARSDVFIFLDDVQYQKTGGSWSNRVRLLISNEARWATAAVDRSYKGKRNINEMRFLTDSPWRTKLCKSIEESYRRHPFFDETMQLVRPLLLNTESNVATYNIIAVTEIAIRLGLQTNRIFKSSELPHSGSSNQLLCSLTHAVGGTAYMCGGGAEDYQDETVFAASGIELQFQKFIHPRYSQRGKADFVSGLSVIDAAMNIGWCGVRELLDEAPCPKPH